MIMVRREEPQQAGERTFALFGPNELLDNNVARMRIISAAELGELVHVAKQVLDMAPTPQYARTQHNGTRKQQATTTTPSKLA
jgi:hypothetical protein